MRLTPALLALLGAAVPALAQPGPAGTYRQVIATRYPDRERLPAGALPPTPTYEFVDRTRLPPDAKVLSAARTPGGTIWVVTDKGAFAAENGRYAPLNIGPRVRE